MTIFVFLPHKKGMKMQEKQPSTRVKKHFCLVSTYFQANVKVIQNLKKIGEMVLAHHGKMVFT